MLRRHFLTVPAALFLTLETGLRLHGEESVGDERAEMDPHRILFLADCHIGPDVPKHSENLKKILSEVLAMRPRPSKLFILGDLVSTYGQSTEYLELQELLRPLDSAGIDWFLVVGNHDTRSRMFEVFPEKKMEVPEIPGKQIGIVESDGVDFVILDSRMDDTKDYMAQKEQFPERRPWDGTMDDASIAWLKKTLTNHSKPVFILVHHPIHQTKLASVLAQIPCVQGYLFGHNHQYLRSDLSGVETFAFPTTSERILTPSTPNGFMILDVRPDGFDFTLKTLNSAHSLADHLETIPKKDGNVE